MTELTQLSTETSAAPQDPPLAAVSTLWLASDERACTAARAHVTEQLTQWACDGDTIDDATLVVSELVSNVVAHSPSRSVGIDVSATARRIVVGVREQGPADMPDPDGHLLLSFDRRHSGVDPSPVAPHGRGLRILDALAAEWGISRSHLSTATWFTLAPSVPPPLHAVSPAAAAQVDALEASVRRLRLLLRITEGLAAATTADQVGAVITRHLREHMGALFTGIALVEPDGHTMRYLTLEPLPDVVGERWSRFPHDGTAPVSAAVIDGHGYFHESPPDAELQFPGLASHMEVAGTGSLAHLPLTVSRRGIGTLCMAWAKPKVIDADSRALLNIVAGAAAQALQRASWTTD